MLSNFKMKKILAPILILFITFFSCNKPTDEKTFLGRWISVNEEYSPIQITFYKDSLVLDGLSGSFHSTSEWKADDTTIYLNNIKIKNVSGAEGSDSDDMEYQYSFNKTNDTLHLKVAEDAPIKTFHFVRIAGQ